MSKPDYRGARGANAGDDYHELWALRQALSLLDTDAGLYAITVEGLSTEDEGGKTSDTWDGVDCTFYYGENDNGGKPDRIVIVQFKYSAANSDQNWTISRLTYAGNKNQDNSVIRKLANAFAGLKGKYPELARTGNMVVRLVSNQPVDPAVIASITDRSDLAKQLSRQGLSSFEKNHSKIHVASSLKESDFQEFIKNLDFLECGGESRFSVEENVLTTISSWIDDDARTSVEHLVSCVRRKMLPEAKGEFITRHTVLSWLGFSHQDALFPCPSKLKGVEHLVHREVSPEIINEILKGQQHICIHGEGGCGKSTLTQEIESLLPAGSILITFDCYGGGRYLDADAYRHRPQDAFLQLSNDLALRLRTPLLVSRSPSLDYPRVFKKRLERAAEVIASRVHNARLVIVVDAADNSIIAAETQPTPEKSFVQDFVSLGDLPENVCFIVTTRTGRLTSLNLSPNFKRLEIKGFNRDETAVHIGLFWKDAPETWIDDFHNLSRGNPRVQRYAIDHARDDPQKALDSLRPSGKDLEQIFQTLLDEARHKLGQSHDIKSFCSGIIALPRPIPLDDFSVVIGLNKSQILDLCADFSPGVQFRDGMIGFADEDFENFMRTEAEEQLDSVNAKIADHFTKQHKLTAYAAIHIASALLAAGRRQEILDLIQKEQEPTAVSDPILRREVQLQRLRIAMKVCRETKNNVDAVLTLLFGAEALKTDAVARKMLIENPDLTVNFARETSSRMILRDADEIENHGRLLFHLMALDSRKGDGISVREEYRQIRAWMKRRADSYNEQKENHPHFQPEGWPIEDNDIAAEIEAVLRIEGPQRAVEQLFRWTPRWLAPRVALHLCYQLITLGEISLIEHCIEEKSVHSPWDLFLLIPLALAGKDVKLSQIEIGLRSLLRRRLIRFDKKRSSLSKDNASAEYLEIILTACEIVIARGGNHSLIKPVLEQFADRELRRRDQLYTSNSLIIDLSLRAFSLLERLEGRKISLETYWIDPPASIEELSDKKVEQIKRADIEKKEELRKFIGPLLDIYDTRTQALLGLIAAEDIEFTLHQALTKYHNEYYRFSKGYNAIIMGAQIAVSLTRLMALPDLRRSALFNCILSFLNSSSFSLIAEIDAFKILALDQSLHIPIHEVIVDRSEKVKKLRSSAENKIDSLIDLARFILTFSRDDAEVIFRDAFQIASEVNADAVHEISLFEPFAKRAAEEMTVEDRRDAAKNYAIIISDAGIRLEGNDNFPWEKASRTLTTLDLPLALAAAARWEDENIIRRDTFFPPLLETTLTRKEFSPARVLALSPLLDDFSEELINKVVNEIGNQQSIFSVKAISEHIAREELLRFGKGNRPLISEKINSLLIKGDIGFWVDQLTQATIFHDKEKPSPQPIPNDHPDLYQSDISTDERLGPLATANLASQSFATPDEIKSVLEAAQMAGKFVSLSNVLDQIKGVVAVRNRTAHLNALTKLEFNIVSGNSIAQAILNCINDWRTSPSVASWSRTQLLQVLIDHLPDYSRGLSYYNYSVLPELLEKTGLEDSKIFTALFEGIERHVDDLGAATIYALIGLIGRYTTASDAALVTKRYSDRLVQRIPTSDRENWDLQDIPTNRTSALARFLYALLSDVDVRNRWRAAHTIRQLACFGDIDTIDELIELYDRTSELSFRDPDAPFYWLAARLWLVIAFEKIAGETPSIMAKHGAWLFDIATNEEFPHIILRSFAKSAVLKLLNENIQLDLIQKEKLERANTSPVPRKKVRNSYRDGFDRYSYQEREGRHFRFDTMDTLPYWYTSALRAFADVNADEFLDVAESWIVDRWNVQNNPWRWEDQPRKHRIDDYSSSTLHNHGSHPTLERYNTYLEWHAMWCTVGGLMQTRALVKNKENEFDSLEYLLRENNLALPPFWLSDLLSPKPLEHSLWNTPESNIELWLDNVKDKDFLGELTPVFRDNFVVVSSYHDTHSHNFRSSVRVNTALVSPKTAVALVHTLQTMSSSWDYTIPLTESEAEIKQPPYTMLGWLINQENVLGMDERDPLRYEVRGIERAPSMKTIKALCLSLHYDGQLKWINVKSGHTVFVYETWGDTLSREREDHLRYDNKIRSSGWRLLIDKKALKTFLDKVGLDLIAEVEITRRNKGYDYSRYDEEKTKESLFDKVFLLRRDGTIETFEGFTGTWEVSSPRTEF